MANIGIGDPIRIRMRKFYGIYMDYPASKHDEWGKKIEEETILKKSVPIVQAIVRTQMKVVEADNASLWPHICSLYYILTDECHSLK